MYSSTTQTATDVITSSANDVQTDIMLRNDEIVNDPAADGEQVQLSFEEPEQEMDSPEVVSPFHKTLKTHVEKFNLKSEITTEVNEVVCTEDVETVADCAADEGEMRVVRMQLGVSNPAFSMVAETQTSNNTDEKPSVAENGPRTDANQDPEYNQTTLSESIPQGVKYIVEVVEDVNSYAEQSMEDKTGSSGGTTGIGNTSIGLDSLKTESDLDVEVEEQIAVSPCNLNSFNSNQQS